jgi:hypothetical protein
MIAHTARAQLSLQKQNICMTSGACSHGSVVICEASRRGESRSHPCVCCTFLILSLNQVLLSVFHEVTSLCIPHTAAYVRQQQQEDAPNTSAMRA